MPIVFCDNPASWHPTLHRNEGHHNPPKSWTTDDGASSRIWNICGICHNEIHSLLNEYKRYQGAVPWSIRKTYGPWIRERAQEAWDERRRDKPVPYTTVEGAVG